MEGEQIVTTLEDLKLMLEYVVIRQLDGAFLKKSGYNPHIPQMYADK
jgi:hypothetical protein